MPRLICVVGARPNFMKVAPILTELSLHPEFEIFLVHTGQHYDDKLSRVFLDELDISTSIENLGIGGGGRNEQIRHIRHAFEPVVHHKRPDLVIVVGDVHSTIACASVAKACGVRARAKITSHFGITLR